MPMGAGCEHAAEAAALPSQHAMRRVPVRLLSPAEPQHPQGVGGCDVFLMLSGLLRCQEVLL